jgi:hypothetical protein
MPLGEQEIILGTIRDEITNVGPLRLNLRRVNVNDPQNDRDDTCELIANTDTQSMTVTLEEGGAPQFVGGWRFQAVDVQPATGAKSGTQSGKGTARIRILHVSPPAGGKAGQ